MIVQLLLNNKKKKKLSIQFFLSEKGRVYKKLSTCFRSLVWISYKKNCVGLSKVLEYKLCINGYDWTTWKPLLIQSFLWLFRQEENSLPLGTIMLISYFFEKQTYCTRCHPGSSWSTCFSEMLTLQSERLVKHSGLGPPGGAWMHLNAEICF